VPPVPKHVYAFLALGLVAASQSGNIIRLGQAHPTAIAAWRLLIAALILAPLARGRLRQLARLSTRDRWLLLAAGFALAFHFFTWIAAVQLTTVARAAIVFSINPVLTGLAAWLIFKERFSPRLVISIVFGLAGVAVIAAEGLGLPGGSLWGDAMAFLCSVLFSAYFLLGKQLRKKLDSRVYVPTLYAIAALVSFGAMAVSGVAFVDYDGQTWLCFVLMGLVPTVLGHTSFNHALNYMPAGRISVATLSEPALAGLVAFFAWSEPISLWTGAGYGLIAASVVVLVMERRNTS
jgi:drug/metabolite transporter (DMT)-like permease